MSGGLIRSDWSNLYLFLIVSGDQGSMNVWELLVLFSSFVMAGILIRLTEFAEKIQEVRDDS